jgi:hypothetical protein
VTGFYGRDFDDDGNEVLDPLDTIREIVKNAVDGDQVPGLVASAIESMAAAGMDTAARVTIRAYLKKSKQIGVTVAQFDDIISRARKGRRKYLSDADPSARDAHLYTPPSWASDQDILARMVAKLRVCMGLVGEDRNAQLVYLTVTSRLLDKHVNVVVKGLSSSGKSYTVECVLKLFPAEAVYTMTAMSEKALIYLSEPLAHRTIVLFEATALREGREKADDNQTAYIVRSLLSEGRIEYPVVLRDEDGTLHTEKIVKEGPTNLVTTTTSVSLHAENETRMLSLPSDDSRDQTRAVLLSAARELPADPDLSDWVTYQRWLGSANHKVTIPFAECIARQIPPVAVRLRRDWNTIRALIETHAMMHQLNRNTDEAGRIIATIGDYAVIRPLVDDLVSDGVGATVSKTVRETVGLVATMTEKTEGFDPPDPDGVTVRKIADLLHIQRESAQRRLSTAASQGYILNLEDKRGRPGRYVIAAPLPGDVVVLPDPDQVCEGVCRCTRAADPRETETYIEEEIT